MITKAIPPGGKMKIVSIEPHPVLEHDACMDSLNFLRRYDWSQDSEGDLCPPAGDLVGFAFRWLRHAVLIELLRAHTGCVGRLLLRPCAEAIRNHYRRQDERFQIRPDMQKKSIARATSVESAEERVRAVA